MGSLVSLLTQNHVSTKRDYTSRADDQKPRYAEIAKQFEFDYWDGDRNTGYGGYRDDGRWKRIAESFFKRYELGNGASILDVGCGKGYFLKELKNLRPDVDVRGIDLSQYAILNSPLEIREFIKVGRAQDLEFNDQSFDLFL